jgi:hypothetical protein
VQYPDPTPTPRRRQSPRRHQSPKRQIAALLAIIVAALPAYAQNTLDKIGLPAGVTASAAYSVRRLSSSYIGKALQVRRSSDNTTQDIGFTANGDLDSTSLKTFVGANNAYVTAWYDQSGHGLNITQSTTSYQPILVTNGVINRENTRPFIQFWGYPHTALNSLALATQMTTVGHVSSVMKLASGGYGFILAHSSVYYWHSNPGVNLFYNLGSSSVDNGNGWVNGSSYAPLSMPWPTTLTVEEIEPTTPGTGTNWDNIGSDRGICCHETSGGGGYSELIIFPTALTSANRQTVESSEGAYWGIVVLQLTWQSFTAKLDNGNVYLQWQTATEQNTGSFTVQYSTDGQTWTDLTTLPAAGNSTGTRTYSYVHYTPGAGDNFYRICETDENGKTNYSTVKVIRQTAQAREFKLLQNPVPNKKLQVQVISPTTLSLFTTAGKLLWKRQCLPGVQDIQLDNAAGGLYLLSGRTTTVEVLVQ